MATESSLQRSEFPESRFKTVAKPSARVALVGLAALVLALLFVRVWLTRKIVTPWILIDELVYSDLARSVADDGRFFVRDQPIPWFNFGYAALIAPAWLVTESQSAAYGIAKALNVLLVASAVVPVYLWARRLVSPAYAAVAAALTALMPALLYAGTLMSENAFLPSFVLACFAIALMLERPTLARQGLALAAIVLATVVRLQGLVLLAVLPTALVLKLLLDARVPDRRSRLRAELVRYWPLAATYVLLGLAYVALKVAQGKPLSTGLGSYGVVAEGRYTTIESLEWVVRHLAGAVLATGVFPVCAFIVLLGLALLRGALVAAERAFLATTVAAVAWVVPQAALFASNFSGRIEERYMFCFFPLLLVALVVWLDRGAPRRPWPLSAAAALASAALLLFALPLRSLLNISILSDTFALIPLLRLSNVFDGGVDDVELAVALAAIAAAVAFVVVPARPAAAVVPLAIAGYFVLGSYAVHGAIRDYALQLTAGTTGPDRAWVDRAAGRGRDVDFLYGGSADIWTEASTLWQTEFWNESVDDVYSLGVAQPAGLVEVRATVDALTGRLNLLPQDVPPDRLVVVSRQVGVEGRLIEAHGDLGLYRTDPPVRLSRRIEGVAADGWMGADAAFTQYAGPGSKRIRVDVSRAAWSGPDVPAEVTIRAGRLAAAGATARIATVAASRRWTIHSGRGRSFLLPAPKLPFRVEVHVSRTFSPADYGQPDSRELGAQVAFRLEGAAAG